MLVGKQDRYSSAHVLHKIASAWEKIGSHFNIIPRDSKWKDQKYIGRYISQSHGTRALKYNTTTV